MIVTVDTITQLSAPGCNKPVCRLTCSTGEVAVSEKLWKDRGTPAVGGPTVPLLSCLGSATKDAAHVSVSP